MKILSVGIVRASDDSCNNASIRDNPSQHEQLCDKIGLSYGSGLPEWKRTPETRSFPLQDLREIGLSVRSAL